MTFPLVSETFDEAVMLMACFDIQPLVFSQVRTRLGKETIKPAADKLGETIAVVSAPARDAPCHQTATVPEELTPDSTSTKPEAVAKPRPWKTLKLAQESLTT